MTADWNRRKWPAGTRVIVHGIERPHRELGRGTLLIPYDPDADWDEPGFMPRIGMDSGGEVLGCDCWWIPEAVAQTIANAPLSGGRYG